MVHDIKNSSTDFLRETFFSTPNTILWDGLNENNDKFEWSNELSAWVANYDQLGVMLLPFIDDGNNLFLYGLFKSDNKTTVRLNELEAFVGQSFAKFSRLGNDSEIKSVFDVALINSFKGDICKIGPIRTSSGSSAVQTDPNTTNQNKIWHFFALYKSVLLKKPIQSTIPVQSFGNLKRDFDKAIFVGNLEEIEKKYEQLISHGRLSFENKLFLEIRKLSGLGMWNQILAQKQLMEDASKLKLPQKVRSDLIEAFYNVSEQIEGSTIDAEIAFSSFKRTNPHRFPRLLGTRQGIIKPKVIKSFIFWELLSQDPDKAQIEACLTIMKEEGTEDPGFLSSIEFLVSSIISQRPSEPSSSRLDKANEALEQFEHEKAFRIYQSLPPDIKVIGKLLTCASFIRTFQMYDTIVTVVKQWEEESGSILPDLLKTALNKIKLDTAENQNEPETSQRQLVENSSTQKNIESWLHWSRALNLKNGHSENELQQYVISASEQWSLSTLKSNPNEIDEFANNIFSAEDLGARVLDQVWINIVEAFLPQNSSPAKQWKPVYNALFSKKLIEPYLDENDHESIRILLNVVLSCGLNQQEYVNLVQDLRELIERELALKTFEWALDICEVIAINRAPDEQSKNNFINYFLSIGYIKVPPHRLNPAQRHLVHQLCLDIKQEALFTPYQEIQKGNEGAPSQPTLDLSKKRIGIYTLTESAGKRSKETLEKLFPGVRVELNNDHVGTDRLKALAENSDIFVFAAKSSTHAAFYFIKNHRDEAILTPTGKGSASIISAILEL